MNGYLIFYNKQKKTGKNIFTRHIIEVDAYSELGGKDCAHFNVYINDSLAGDFYAEKKKKKYDIYWYGSLAEIDSIMVQFDNDKSNGHMDRNLYIKGILIDQKINIPYQNNSIYYIGKPDGKKLIVNNFNSYAELARNRLVALGIDSSVIIPVPGKRVHINRTLSSAIALRNRLKKPDIKITGLNIITLGIHARRTKMTYTKILKNQSFAVGVLSLPDHMLRCSNKYRFFMILRETFAIIYYWCMLFFF